MIFLLIAAPPVVLLLWYILSGREYLKKKAWAQGFFRWIEPIELLYGKSETILTGRLLWVGSLLVGAYDAVATFVASLNWTPVTSRVLAQVPEDLRGLLVSVALFMLGLLINWLRKRTTKPLEVVAVAQRDITPVVAEKMAMAESAKHQAVAAVKLAAVHSEAEVVSDAVADQKDGG